MSLVPAGVVIPDPRSLSDNANLPTTNKKETIIGVTICIVVLAVLATCFRVWVRYRRRLWGLDDAFVILAVVTSTLGDVVVCMMPDDGLGLHLWTLDHQHLSQYFKHVYLTSASYVASAAFIKLSILFQFLRLFSESASSTSAPQSRLARRSTWAMIMITALWGSTFILLAIFPCHPIEKNWNMNLPGTCIGWGSKVPDVFYRMFMGHTASNMALDFMVLLLPLPFLKHLQLGPKSRIGFISLYSLACTVSALAIGRLIAFTINRAGTVPRLDMSYFTPAIYIFGVLEINVAIITACVPIFWPVITGLAVNKIFVLREIDVHVENASRGQSLDSAHNMVLAPTRAFKDDGTNPRSLAQKSFNRTNSRSSTCRHMLNLSRRRSSEDALRSMYRPSQEVDAVKGVLSREASQDYFLEIDSDISGGKTTTKVERALIPLEHIEAFDHSKAS